MQSVCRASPKGGAVVTMRVRRAISSDRLKFRSMKLDAEQAIGIAKGFLLKAGTTYFFLVSVEPVENDQKWRVVASSALFTPPKELLIDDESGKVLVLREHKPG
jgi:hypothetical protein